MCAPVLLALTASLALFQPAKPQPVNVRAASNAAHDRASELAASGKLDEAEAAFIAAAKTDPSNANLSAARAIFSDFRAGRISADVVQFLFRTTVFANKQEWSAAQADADAAVKQAPQYARAYDARAQFRMMRGDYPAALKDLDRAVALDAGFAQSLYHRGAIHAEAQGYDRAIAEYDRAISASPGFAEAFRNRGSAYANTGKLDAAIADYTHALRLDPLAGETFLHRGYVYANRGQFARAIEDYDRAIALDPDLVLALFNKGQTYEAWGRRKDAIAAYEAFVAKASAEDAKLIETARARLRALGK